MTKKYINENFHIWVGKRNRGVDVLLYKLLGKKLNFSFHFVFILSLYLLSIKFKRLIGTIDSFIWNVLMPLQVYPPFSTFRLCVFDGLPWEFLPSDVRMISSCGFLRVWPIHFYLRRLSSLIIVSCFVLFQKDSLEIVLVQKTRRNIRRQLHINYSSICSSPGRSIFCFFRPKTFN